jgi:NAD(P)-dependent dehydrogenase (short-subunit alcohol dehydrogenase family)
MKRQHRENVLMASLKLNGKTALITGGAQGIGLASAEAMARAGANIIGFDLIGSDWSQLEAAVSAQGRRLLKIEGDVANEASWSEARRVVESKFGGLDVLFNNAGISGPRALLRDCPVDAFDEVMRVNCRGVFLGMQAGAELMRDRGGSIINMSSVSGLGGGRFLISYNASKHAVIGMTKVGAVELAPLGIRVNAICPAMTDTPMMRDMETGKSEREIAELRGRFTAMIPMARYAAPEEVAAVALFLASGDSSFVNGAALPVDGGLKAQ